MSALAKSILHFGLNWLDAQLTIVWTHSHLASEGNCLMAQLLQVGDAPFMVAKFAVGGFAAYILYRSSHLALARHGMQLVLTIYTLLMFAHAATGLSALGWSQPQVMISYFTNLPYGLLTLFS
jgi:hypothetical protein